MAQPPKKVPDRHYDFRKTNIVFAWSSVGLLAVTLWMVFADYAKPWKRLQAEFRELERQKLAAEAEAERDRLNENEIAQIREEIAAEAAALEARSGEIDELESQFERYGRQIYAADAEMRTTKSKLDTATYTYDVAIQSGDEAKIAERRERVAALEARYREDRKRVEALTESRDQVEATLTQARSGVAEDEARLAALRSGLSSIERRVENLDKELGYFVLNAPLIDFLEPDLKIDQVILDGLYQNINFTTVGRVDRCRTCHVAADRSGFDGEEWQEPFRSHPRLDLFLSAGSPHPYTEFGCTTCHGGLDRATDFARVGHSPTSEEQKEAWKEEWGWEVQKFLDSPILPAGTSEAGCVTCHAGNIWVPGAETLNTGRELINRMSCYGCHLIDYPAFRDLPRPGPNLNRVASKTNAGWAYRWIEAPREFHPTTFMPHFFFQENVSLPENLERQKAEIRSLVTFIWDRSERLTYPAPPAGDAGRGRELFETVGCTGCHLLDAGAKRDDFFGQINRLHGPNLIRTGSKVDPGWLYAWIRDPKQYNPDTRMPNLRLTESEAADIVAYLMTSRDPEFEALELPAVDAALRDELVADYFQNTLTIEQSQARIEQMSEHERDAYLGEQTVQKYGCYACHDLAGFDDAKPIGVELTEEGSKPLHQFDFGHVHDVPHTRHDWIRTKLLRPRIWDDGKEPVKDYHELYKMPNFGMTEREASAVLVNVLGFTKESVAAERKPDRSRDAKAIAAGRKLITTYNCQGCHLLEGQGHAIRTAIEEIDLLPPNLASEGARVRSEWLFEYLHDPGAVRLRPWLGVRMPTFGFDDEQINTLLAYFAATEGREPFLSEPVRPERRELVVGEVAFTMFQCAKCHPAGPQAAVGVGGVSAGELAPSLLLARERLRHDWVPSWILDPQSFIPGTRMPANFAPEPEGGYQSPIAGAIDAPMFSEQKKRLLAEFDGDEEALKAYLADAERVTTALRDHIWWNLN